MKNIAIKSLTIVFAILLFAGCSRSLNDRKPEEAVKTFFEKYRSKDDNIITQLKETIENETLSDDAKEKYQNLMEKQYDSLSYVIKDIKEDKDKAIATVEVTVLNYKSAILKAEEELKNNPEKFNDDKGNFSDEEYMDYKIEKMQDVKDTVTHTIDLSLTKKAGIWAVDELSSDDISKIHGLY